MAAVFPVTLTKSERCNGQLSLGPKPDADHLNGWTHAIKHAGVSRCITLLTDEDLGRHGLAHLPTRLLSVGIESSHFPIEDYGVPASTPAFDQLVHGIAADIRAGRGVHVHCAAGIGRSGLTCVCVLMVLGLDRESAIARVSKARGCVVPETPVQDGFLAAFAERQR